VALDGVQNLDLALHVDHIFGRKQLLLRDHLSIVLTGTAVAGKHCLSHDEPLCYRSTDWSSTHCTLPSLTATLQEEK
jgi:hypothetical protein